VFIVFYDAPDPVVIPLILDMLERTGVKATFFVLDAREQ